MDTKQLGQLFVFGFQPDKTDLSRPTPEILELIQVYGAGAVILFRRNIENIDSVHTLIRRLQRAAKDSGHAQPLLIGIDQEGGLACAFSNPVDSPDKATLIPGAMTCAACKDPADAVKCTISATAQELKMAGVNWVFAPVADVNSNPNNPVIGSRSYGDDPEQVSKLVVKATQTFQESGIVACAKHFPGHGDTSQDSHLSAAIVNKSLEDLEKIELVPFRRLAPTIPSIMTAHVSLPQIDGDCPASLSRTVTTGLLRDKLQYDGVIVTDCLEMEAVMGLDGGTEQGSMRAISAGADIAMACHTAFKHRGAVKALEKAVNDGSIPMSQIEASLERVRKLKQKYIGSWSEWEQTFASSDNTKEYWKESWRSAKKVSTESAQSVYRQSTTLVHSVGNFPPNLKSGRVLLFSPKIEKVNAAVDDEEQEDTSNRAAHNRNPYRHLEESLIKRGVDLEHIQMQPENFASLEQTEKRENFCAVIIATRNADRKEWQKAAVSRICDAFDCPIVVAATCSPYDYLDCPTPFSYLCTYEYTPPALDALAAVLCGEFQASGRLPVSLHSS